MALKLRVKKLNVGNSTTSVALESGGKGISAYVSNASTSGEVYGIYTKMTGTGAGAEFIGSRARSVISAAAGNAHGAHNSLEFGTSAGNVTGLGTAHRANIIVPNRAIAAGTYYGVMAEIYPSGNSSALPANSNACLGINAQPGTAMDLVANAIAFSGTDGSGKMIYTHAPTTLEGSIRILVNGVAKYLPFYTTA
jgi:hypothetical protein